MPLTQEVAYSKPVTLPNGKKTLALYNASHRIIEYRACKEDKKTGKFTCPSQASKPKERAKIQKELGLSKLNKKLKN